MDNDAIVLNKSNYKSHLLKIIELCVSLSKHEENTPLTPGERKLALELLKLLQMEINFYSTVGLPSERLFFQDLQKEIRKLL